MLSGEIYKTQNCKTLYDRDSAYLLIFVSPCYIMTCGCLIKQMDWDTMKAVLRGKFIAWSAFQKRMKTQQLNGALLYKPLEVSHIGL